MPDTIPDDVLSDGQQPNEVTTPKPCHSHYHKHRYLNWCFNKLMVESKWPTRIRNCFLVITWVCGLMLSVLEYISEKPSEENSLEGFVVKYVIDNRQSIALTLFWILIFSGIITLLISFAVKYLQRIDFKSAKRILNRLESVVFEPDIDDESISNDRVTLFKIRRLPFNVLGEWAGIICRSGEFSQRSNTIFSIHRDGKDEENTGCIGKSFLAKGNVWREELPVKNPDDYKKSCFVTDEEYKRIKKKPHYLYVVNIKDSNHNCWGFLCVDSDSEKTISVERKKKIKLLVAEHALHIQYLISFKA